MMRFSRNLLSVQALLSFVLMASAQIPRKVVLLDQDTFEPTTQASTGQTTGIWFVLFNDKTHHRAGEANAVWMQLGMDEDKDYIVAEVFLNEAKSRAIAWQFDMIQPPSAVLFRDQMMYVYPKPLHELGALRKLQEFAAESYLQVAPQYVPGSIFGHKKAQEVQEEWVEDRRKKSAFDWKTALFGVASLIVGFWIKSWAKKKRLEEIIEKVAKERENEQNDKTPKAEDVTDKPGKGRESVDKAGVKKTK